MSNRLVFGACTLFLSIGPCVSAAAEPSKTGVTWEDTFEMSAVQGFAMPAQTRQSCRPADPEDWKGPPSDSKDDCRITEMKRVGSRMSWKVVCEKSRMTGDGDITWTPDTYTGNVAMHSPEHGDMTMKLRGRKLGGACDPERERQAVQDRRREAERQAEQYQAMVAQGQAQMCDAAVQSLNWNMLEQEQCKPRRGEACARLQTLDGYRSVERLPDSSRAKAERTCGIDLASIKARLCEKAPASLRPGARASKDDPNADTLRFISQECPAERQALIQRECAGRSYTGKNTPADWIRSFCVEYAKEELQRGSPKPARAEAVPASEEKPQRAPDPKDDAIEKAKKAAKGIFGF